MKPTVVEAWQWLVLHDTPPRNVLFLGATLLHSMLRFGTHRMGWIHHSTSQTPPPLPSTLPPPPTHTYRCPRRFANGQDNGGTPEFVVQSLASVTSAASITAADLDGDGHVDAVVAAASVLTW
jgi:hypothetical protein